MEPPIALAQVPQVPHGHTARRLGWQHLPPRIRSMVQARLGESVVEATSQGGGFTPGFALRLVGQHGAQMFIKAASVKAQRQFADAYATEFQVLESLGHVDEQRLPAPRPLWAHRDEDWVVIAFEDVEAHAPQRPWHEGELTACLDVLSEVAAATQTLDETVRSSLLPVHEELPSLVTGWSQWAATGNDEPHLADLEELAARLPDLPGGRFLHLDARDDNFLITPDGSALLCDWNWPCLGPVWLDVVVVLVCAHGDGLDADARLATHPLTAEVPADHIDVWLAAYAGFMRVSSAAPRPRTSPYLRMHQHWYAEASLSWLAQRLDFGPPSARW